MRKIDLESEMHEIDFEAAVIDDIALESLIFDIYNKLKTAITGAIDYLEDSAVEFLDQFMHTGLPKDIRAVARNVKKLDIDFLQVKDAKIHTTPGFGKRLDLVSDFVAKNIDNVVKDTNHAMDVFDDEIGVFISDSEYRKKNTLIIGQYKDVETRQKKLNTEFINLLHTAKGSETTVGEIIGNVRGYQTMIANVDDVFSRHGEKDLKIYLKRVRGTKGRLEVVEKILKRETVSENASKELFAVITLLANQVTLLSKLFSAQYETAIVIKDIYEVVKGD